MSHHDRQATIFTTSFLDLCCCALGAMIIMAVILVPKPAPKRIEVERQIQIDLSLPAIGEPGSSLQDPIDRAKPDSYRQLLTGAPMEIDVYINHQLVKKLALQTRSDAQARAVADRQLVFVEPGKFSDADSAKKPTNAGTFKVEAIRRQKTICLGHDKGGPHLTPAADGAHENSLVQIRFIFDVERDQLESEFLISLHFRIPCRDTEVPQALAQIWRSVGKYWNDLAIDATGQSIESDHAPSVFAQISPEGARRKCTLPVPWFSADKRRFSLRIIKSGSEVPMESGVRPSWSSETNQDLLGDILGHSEFGWKREKASWRADGYEFTTSEPIPTYDLHQQGTPYSFDVVVTAKAMFQETTGEPVANLVQLLIAPVCDCGKGNLCPINKSIF